jgi:cob(I)alamin adenosyltransferase
MKIYTKTGDDGTTGLFGNARVRKDALRIEAYGEVDELNASLGVVIAHLPSLAHSARGWLDAIQSDLFILGALLATPPQAERKPAALPPQRVQALEEQIDQMEKNLKPLKNFILPQGTPCAAFLHLCRAISRRAERRVVALDSQEKVDPLILIYMNRLSDFLFVLARWVNFQEGGTETAWINPSGDSPGQPQADRLTASLGKLEMEKERRKSLFEKTTSDLQKKKAEAEKLFKQNVDQINKEGGKVEKPVREIDLD